MFFTCDILDILLKEDAGQNDPRRKSWRYQYHGWAIMWLSNNIPFTRYEPLQESWRYQIRGHPGHVSRLKHPWLIHMQIVCVCVCVCVRARAPPRLPVCVYISNILATHEIDNHNASGLSRALATHQQHISNTSATHEMDNASGLSQALATH